MIDHRWTDGEPGGCHMERNLTLCREARGQWVIAVGLCGKWQPTL